MRKFNYLKRARAVRTSYTHTQAKCMLELWIRLHIATESSTKTSAYTIYMDNMVGGGMEPL